MRVRLFFTIALLVPFVALVWADLNHNLGAPCAWLFLLALITVQLATLELYPLLAREGQGSSVATYQSAVLLVLLGTAIPVYWPVLSGEPYPVDCPVGRLGCTLFGFLAAMGLAVGQQMNRYRAPTGTALTEAALVIFTAGYLGVLASFLVLLRTFHSNEWGMVALISTVAIVKVADIGAYVTGRFFGRHRMAPLLSPKKTIEGAIGGLLAAVGMALACPVLLVEPLLGSNAAIQNAWPGWLLLGVVLCVAGMVGDLAESLIKRDSGQKDSSRWLPGLGGMLDLLDSMLVAAPVAYAAWVVGLIGPGAS